MKIVSCIPARGGSKTIHKKNLYPLNGQPLLYYTIQASILSGIDETWVSTDCPEITEYALLLEARVLQRPAYLASDTATTESALIHFAKNVDFDVLVVIQPTSPMIIGDDIHAGIELFKTGKYTSVISTCDGDDILIWDKKWKHPMNYDPYNRGRRQERLNTFVIETGGFYIISKEELLKTHCRVTNCVGFCYIPFWRSFEIDTMEDLKMVERLMK